MNDNEGTLEKALTIADHIAADPLLFQESKDLSVGIVQFIGDYQRKKEQLVNTGVVILALMLTIFATVDTVEHIRKTRNNRSH